MNKLAVTTLESKFFIYDMRTQHPTHGFASLTEKVNDSQQYFVVPSLNQYAVLSGAQIAYCLVSVSPASKQGYLHDSRWKWDFTPLEIVCIVGGGVMGIGKYDLKLECTVLILTNV